VPSPPGSPTIGGHLAGEAAKLSGSLGHAWMGTPTSAASSRRRAAPKRDEASDTWVQATSGLVRFGEQVTRQLSDVVSVFTDGGNHLENPCGKHGSQCCIAHGGPPGLPHTLSNPGLSGSFLGDVAVDISPTNAGFAPHCQAAGFGGVARTGFALPPRSALAQPASTVPNLLARRDVAGQDCTCSSSTTPDEQELAGGPTVVLKASLSLDGAPIGVLRVCATDRCREVAARFVADHGLAHRFEAPLVAYLMKAESDAERFPVLLSADLECLCPQHDAGAR